MINKSNHQWWLMIFIIIESLTINPRNGWWKNLQEPLYLMVKTRAACLTGWWLVTVSFAIPKICLLINQTSQILREIRNLSKHRLAINHYYQWLLSITILKNIICRYCLQVNGLCSIDHFLCMINCQLISISH